MATPLAAAIQGSDGLNIGLEQVGGIAGLNLCLMREMTKDPQKDSIIQRYAIHHVLHFLYILTSQILPTSPLSESCSDLKDGTVYEGYFLDGCPHGYGRIKWPEGTVYDGDWNGGETWRSGSQTFVWMGDLWTMPGTSRLFFADVCESVNCKCIHTCTHAYRHVRTLLSKGIRALCAHACVDMFARIHIRMYTHT